MRVHESVTQERVMDAVEADDNIGFCVFCGEENYGVEPDARRHRCDTCGQKGVFGAQELLFHLS